MDHSSIEETLIGGDVERNEAKDNPMLVTPSSTSSKNSSSPSLGLMGYSTPSSTPRSRFHHGLVSTRDLSSAVTHFESQREQFRREKRLFEENKRAVSLQQEKREEELRARAQTLTTTALAKKLEEKEIEIRELKAECKKLRNQLHSIELRTAKPSPEPSLKPFSSLHRTRQTERVSKADSLLASIAGRTDDLQAEKKEIIERVAKNHGLKTKPIFRLTPEEDVQILMKSGLSLSQRRAVKSEFIARGFDPFAPTNKVEALRKKMVDGYDYSFTEETIDGKEVCILTLDSVEKALTSRAQSLLDAGKLDLESGKYNGSIWLCIVGDKGADTTKLCVFFGNVENANSWKNLSVLGIFNADDNSENMRKLLPGIVSQINSLSHLVLQKNKQTTTIPITWFATGDLKFLYGIIGHRGHTVRHNCMFCERTRGAKAGTAEPLFPARDINKYMNQAKCADKSPMFPNVPLRNYIPCCLHILMGLVDNILVSELQSQARQKDGRQACKSRDLRAVDILKGEVRECEKILADLSLQKQGVDAAIRCAEAIRSKQIVPGNGKTCDGKTCLLLHADSDELLRESTKLASCDSCNRTSHYACNGKVLLDDIMRFESMDDDGDSFYCSLCYGSSSNDDRMDELIRARNTIDTAINSHLVEKRAKEAKHHQAVISIGIDGPNYKELEKRFTQVGASLTAYHPKLTGNHAVKCLTPDALDVLFENYDATPDGKSRKESMRILGHILSNYAGTTDLSNGMILGLQKSLWQLDKACAGIKNGELSSTPKYHILQHHLVDYLSAYRSWTQMSEQGIESLHRYFNNLGRRFACLRSTEIRWKAMIREMTRENAMFDR